MEINLDDYNKFFQNPKSVPMPKSLMSLIDLGSKFIFEELETGQIEWHELNGSFSPEIARRIDPQEDGYNIPFVSGTVDPETSIYHPRTGEYLGTY